MTQTEIECVAKPGRVVVLGSRGVLGHALVNALQVPGKVTTPVVAVSFRGVDFLADTAARDLAAYLRSGDAVVMLFGLTPDKGRWRSCVGDLAGTAGLHELRCRLPVCSGNGK